MNTFDIEMRVKVISSIHGPRIQREQNQGVEDQNKIKWWEREEANPYWQQEAVEGVQYCL